MNKDFMDGFWCGWTIGMAILLILILIFVR